MKYNDVPGQLQSFRDTSDSHSAATLSVDRDGASADSFHRPRGLVGFLVGIGESSARTAPPRLYPGISLWELGQIIWTNAIRDNYLDLAAEMSFYFSLSLFPFLIVMAALVGMLPSTTLWHNLARWITNYLPHEARSMVFMVILDLTQNSMRFFSLGLVATIWTASSGFVCLMESLTIAYGARETRGFCKKRIIAICATLLGALFLVVSFGLLTLGHWAANIVALRVESLSGFQLLWDLARWFASLLLMVVGLDLIHYFLPNVKRPWHWLTPGTLLVVLALVAGPYGFNFYLHHFGNYPRFYGTVAAFAILMTWIYVASLILLLGAETDSVLDHLKRPKVAA
jgi:membrane protein